MTYVIPVKRAQGRLIDQMRPVTIEPGVIAHAEGSAMITIGGTKVLCTATVDDYVPGWMKGSNAGWVTAEYSMLPRAGKERSPREAVKGKQGGRTVEIQRLIGRSLRAVMDMKALGERQIILDCDVITADGGTRCASITGAYVAMAMACHRLVKDRHIRKNPLQAAVAAVSVGIVNGVPMLDLEYTEDSRADVDANIVKTDAGGFVEFQSTAEHHPFSQDEMMKMIALADKGLEDLFALQQEALRS